MALTSEDKNLSDQLNERIRELEAQNNSLIREAAISKSMLEKYRQLMDNINDLVCEIDENGVYTYLNKQYSTIMGYEPSELIGHQAIELIHPEDMETSISKHRQIRDTLGRSIDIWRFKHKNGTYRTIESRGTVYQNQDNKNHTVVISRDITDIEQIETELHQREEQYRLLVENMNAGVFKSTLSGTFINVNRVVAVMSGFNGPEELIGKDVSLLYANLDDSDRLREALMRDGEVRNMELQSRKKDGTPQWISLNAVLMKDPHGVPESILGIVFEIAERKKMDEALRISEKKFRQLHESMMDGFVFVSSEGRLLEFNSTYINMLGYDPEELMQMSFQDITPQKWHAIEKKIVEDQIIARGYSDVYEKEYIRKDGSIFPVELRAFLIKDEHNSPIGMWGIARDITIRKKQESNLINLNKQLTDIVATKDKLFSIIAHDLRSPFDTILGFSELLSGNIKSTEPEVIEDYISRIHSTTQQTHYLLENLLNWARTQTGQLDFQPEFIPLKAMARQAISLVRLAAGMKEITVENLVPDKTTVFADKNMLQSILRNLISNAIKYTSKGGKITIHAAQVKAGIEVIVEDNGIGMDDFTRKNLLLKNEFITTRGTAKEKGAGLGLTICKEFIQKNKGKIWIESQKGKGSRFYFVLPAS